MQSEHTEGLTFDEDRARMRVFYVLHKRILLLPQDVLVHQASVSEDVRCQVIHRVDCLPPAGQD